MHKENDKSKAICKKCKKVVSTTFLYKKAEVRGDKSVITIPNLLVAVCDECSTTVAIPQVSFPIIKIYKDRL